MSKERSLVGYVGVVARGFCMGSADVVPGVSGGTMAFILGIYEELLESIRAIGQPEFIRAVLRFDIGEALQLMNWKFLAAIFAGIVLAALTLLPGIEWLLENQPVYLWAFFFGLVVASVIVVSKRVTVWTPLLYIALLIGAIGAYIIVGLVPVQTPEDWWFLILSGAIAICAMILPGISGSFILVLLSKYEFFVNAVNQRDLVSIMFAGIGAAIGIVTFAQILSWLFKRYHNITVALLTGLMIGSLRKVWPWKRVDAFILDRHNEMIPTVESNILPAMSVNGTFNMGVLIALALAVVGFGLVILLDRVGQRS
ncbi:MAG: DUF368 domain-containing protein [Chloroflexota bacterium]